MACQEWPVVAVRDGTTQALSNTERRTLNMAVKMYRCAALALAAGCLLAGPAEAQQRTQVTSPRPGLNTTLRLSKALHGKRIGKPSKPATRKPANGEPPTAVVEPERSGH
jgi:hypothetical protein